MFFVGKNLNMFSDSDFKNFRGKATTDHDGHFEVSGFSHEFTTIDPKINIYHVILLITKLVIFKYLGLRRWLDSMPTQNEHHDSGQICF